MSKRATSYPEAKDFGYTGNMGWYRTADWYRWKIAQHQWLIGYLQVEIDAYESEIRRLEGTE